MILGVYSNYKNYKRLLNGKLQWKMTFLAKAAAKEGVQILVFSTPSIDWYNKKINGLTYNTEKKTWNIEICPFPDIIYDRATFSDKEKEAGKFVRERLTNEYTIPFLNCKSYFNKWKTHEILSQDPITAQYLPKTAIYFHPIQIIEFLDKYDSVYIKDSAGKLGKNIFKVKKYQDDMYSLKYQASGKNHFDILSLQEIHKILIYDKLAEKNIIIQQGIDVAQLNEHPFDIRCLVQKNDSTNWEVVDKSVRIAAPGSVVTNVSSGGEVRNFNDVVPILFSNSTGIYNEIDMLIIRVCDCLEKKYGHLGELGVDIAIDNKGKVWLIEINGKPAKLCIYRSGNLELIYKTCSNIAKYSKELYRVINNKYTKFECIEGEKNDL
jgi:glutathione synthase/RimK-type ligase-like ATP-grasp enzyme